MNISERLTRWVTETGLTAVLRDGEKDATTVIPVNGWTLNGDGRMVGTALFGPYPENLTASGVRVVCDGAADDVTFKTALALPAGQTYRYTVSVKVSNG